MRKPQCSCATSGTTEISWRSRNTFPVRLVSPEEYFRITHSHDRICRGVNGGLTPARICWAPQDVQKTVGVDYIRWMRTNMFCECNSLYFFVQWLRRLWLLIFHIRNVTNTTLLTSVTCAHIPLPKNFTQFRDVQNSALVPRRSLIHKLIYTDFLANFRFSSSKKSCAPDEGRVDGVSSLSSDDKILLVQRVLDPKYGRLKKIV